MNFMRKPRRRMITIAIVSCVMIGLAGLAAYAWMEKREAETRGRIALLAAQSRSLLESEFDLALLLSVEANRIAEDKAGSGTFWKGLMKKASFASSNENYAGGAAKSSLFAALTLLPQRVRFFREAGQIIAFSPDGRLLASWDSSANIKLWDVAGRRQVGRSFTKIGSTNITSLSFSPDGQTLAVLYDLKEACLWDLRTSALIGSLPDSPYKSDYSPRRLRHCFLAYSPDGKTLVWVSTGDKVRLYDVDLQSWKNRARGIANRNLTPEERQQYLGEQP